MRIAVSSKGEDLDAEVEPRFGRAPCFLLVETETMAFEVVKNTQGLDLPQGAGIQAAQNIAPHEPAAVLTGNCGPKAFMALEAAGIEVIVGIKGRIRDALKAYLNGQCRPAKEANVEGHWV